MDFFLFLLVTGVLFLRPQDLLPSVADVPFYNILIVINLVLAAPAIVNRLRGRWKQSPALLCVLGIVLACVLSLLARWDLAGAAYWGLEFAKVVAYFLLVIAVVTTPRRFVAYLTTIVALTVALAAVATLHYHGQVEIPSIKHAREIAYDAETGDQAETLRLAAFGVFADPNDLSMIVVMSGLICLAGIFHRPLGPMRILLAVPLVFLAYALALTQSRGGLLALMAGLGVFLVNRFGVTRSLIAAAVLIPVLLALFSGRQADLIGGIARGTGGGRTDLWYAGLQMFKWSPVVGMGHGQFVQETGLVAHSSYLHALAEWGLIGGAMFIGLFYIVLHSTWRLKAVRRQIASPALRSLYPYMLGALAAYAASMLTLTRCDVVPTYLVAGLGVTYERLARRGTRLAPLEVNYALAGRVLLVTGAFVAATYTYIRFIFPLFLDRS